ncbi:unnamed protein product [Lactuca saligna]|uniref:Uncharacterized protein n=1 Tax=Lactuca saligna TaxID=75948 RepID=A0AA35YV70_LACSI|nr:unnamed protein product [Lactuca saligna]
MLPTEDVGGKGSTSEAADDGGEAAEDGGEVAEDGGEDDDDDNIADMIGAGGERGRREPASMRKLEGFVAGGDDGGDVSGGGGVRRGWGRVAIGVSVGRSKKSEIYEEERAEKSE